MCWKPSSQRQPPQRGVQRGGLLQYFRGTSDTGLQFTDVLRAGEKREEKKHLPLPHMMRNHLQTLTFPSLLRRAERSRLGPASVDFPALRLQRKVLPEPY
ncbi:hypothetical protein JZ751_007765 [Albula glossodonta]|uniref:Uncharacterized protein n=1 Tax=Albula glossodonta TaxID=121402 RepID=A0A8T2P2I5_9TELE|nr:hypothetical protein JZ751_007765 [Albula glossodonta]